MYLFCFKIVITNKMSGLMHSRYSCIDLMTGQNCDDKKCVGSFSYMVRKCNNICSFRWKIVYRSPCSAMTCDSIGYMNITVHCVRVSTNIMISLYLISHNLTSPHLTSPRLTSPQLASPHLNLASTHLTSPRCTSTQLEFIGCIMEYENKK